MAFVGRSDVKDPGAQQEQWDRIARRRERLYADDAQFRATKPDDTVAAAARRPGLRIAQVMATVMEGYADRPALGSRARELTTDPATGQTTLRFRSEFVTVSYRQLWDRVRALAADWHHHGEHPLLTGDFVCVLGFASVDYAVIELACIHLGAVVVPLQTSAPATQHAPILAETEPRILLASIASLGTAVESLLLGSAPQRLIVFDYEPGDDGHRARFEAAAKRLADAGCPLKIERLDDIVVAAADLPAAPLHVAAEGEDPLAWVFYTSGTTGTPKGAMLTESLCIGSWLAQSDQPVITLSYMPMSHLIGYGYVLMTLANGGTSYFAASSDLSTLFDDLAAARPTTLSLVPRVCEMFYHHFLGEFDKATIGGEAPEAAEQRLLEDLRERVLGGRVLACGCGSAALSPEIKDFMEQVLDQHLMIGYSSTEIAGGMLLADEHVLRPPVIDYKLDDVPELGYFNTDKPYPRGELLVKSQRFMAGYYKRPDLTATMYDADGYYRTGDIMAEVAPDRLRFVDRRNNVIKLSQGEFVAVARLEALYTRSPLVRQIYLYGTSERAFLLGVVVPTDPTATTSEIAASLLAVAHENELNSYEIPRDLLIETEPFSLENGLLSGVGKFLRPKFKERYGPRLEQRYAELAENQARQLRALRADGPALPVADVVARAVQATLGLSPDDLDLNARFIDLGGDSLSALTISRLLADILGAEVPVGVVTDPTGSLASLALYIERQRNSESKVSFGSVHGAGAVEIRAADLTLDKFIDTDILEAASALPRAGEEIRSVLVTGVTGFLGRFLGLEWLQRMADVGGTVTYLARGANPADARGRIETALESDPGLLQRFRELADGRLEVVAADTGEPRWGLDEATWTGLAESIDLIVHPAAHVNHVLPYDQLFPANVAGTAELIRLALTAKLKTVHYISTMGVTAVTDHIVDEDSDIRRDVPVVSLSEGYANGYGVSKWASEVLLREAHDLCDLPVAVFRPGMILADRRFGGQLNVPDIFTRLLFSIIATGVAPRSFYLGGSDGVRPHYEGLPVDFLAGVIADIGARGGDSFATYNTTNPHDDGVSLDTFVDWLIDSGFPVQRVADYSEWLARFETALHALPERAKQQSVLTVLDVYRHPAPAVPGSPVPAADFRAAVHSAGREIPSISRDLIVKYVDDMRLLGML